jgi:hypothetical protein
LSSIRVEDLDVELVCESLLTDDDVSLNARMIAGNDDVNQNARMFVGNTAMGPEHLLRVTKQLHNCRSVHSQNRGSARVTFFSPEPVNLLLLGIEPGTPGVVPTIGHLNH